MKRKGVLFTCLNDGCSVRVMGVRLNSLLHFILTVRACAGVENTCAVSIFDNDCVCECACVGIWMCVWCVHVGIRVGVGFCSIPTLVI